MTSALADLQNGLAAQGGSSGAEGVLIRRSDGLSGRRKADCELRFHGEVVRSGVSVPARLRACVRAAVHLARAALGEAEAQCPNC